MATWGREERQEELRQKLAAWKQLRGADQPIAEDGSKKPLTLCVARCATDGSGRIVNRWPVRPDTDPIDLADDIHSWCYGHGAHYQLAGSFPTYVIEFHFANEREPTAEFPIEVIVDKPNGLGMPMTDLRDRKNQEATVVTHLLQHGTRKDELFVGGVGELIRGYKDLNEGYRKFNEQVQARADKLADQNEKLVTREHERIRSDLDMEIKRDEHRVKTSIKKAGLELGLPMLSLVGGQVYKALGNGLGVKSMPFDERMMKIAEKLYKDPKAREIVLETLDDDDKAALAIALQEYERKKQEEKMTTVFSAAQNGVMRTMPFAALEQITKKQAAGES